jgi:hypothetical protein
MVSGLLHGYATEDCMIAMLLPREYIAPDTKMAEYQAEDGTCFALCGNEDPCPSTDIFALIWDVVCSFLKICPLAYSAVSTRQLNFEVRTFLCSISAYCLEH